MVGVENELWRMRGAVCRVDAVLVSHCLMELFYFIDELRVKCLVEVEEVCLV